MLNIYATSGGSPTITRITIKKASDAPGAVVDLDLTELIEDPDTASEVDGQVPGTSVLYGASVAAAAAAKSEASLEGAAAGATAAAALGPFGQYAVPVSAEGRVTLSVEDDAIEAPATVRRLLVKSTPKVCALQVRVQLKGVESHDVARLVEFFLSDQPLLATFEVRQTVLPFKPVAVRTSPTLTTGEVVSGFHNGIEYAGVVAGTAHDDDDGELVEVDDCGTVYLVPPDTVAGSFTLAEGRDDALKRFKKLCEAKGVEASWIHLVTALGTTYLGDEAAGEQWRLSDEVLTLAARYAEAA